MYKKGDIVEVRCTAVNAWGAFYEPVNLPNNDPQGDQKSSPAKISGMVHISQFSDDYVKDINEYAVVGETYNLAVLSYNEEKSQISLSYKALHKDKNEGLIHIKESGSGFEDLSNNLSQWIDQSNEHVTESE